MIVIRAFLDGVPTMVTHEDHGEAWPGVYLSWFALPTGEMLGITANKSECDASAIGVAAHRMFVDMRAVAKHWPHVEIDWSDLGAP